MPLVTIHDIARAAGVSPMTVSRVLNGRPDVAGATRERVKKIMAEMGFVPHAAARTLRSGRFKAIGYLGTTFGQPYWSRLAFGVHALCSQRGMALVLGDTVAGAELGQGQLGTLLEQDRGFTLDNMAAGLESERRQLGIMLEQGVDGIIVDPVSIHSEALHVIHERRVPVVGLHIAADGCQDVARVDEAGGIRVLMERLLARGCRRIALLNGPVQHPHAHWRYGGYQSSLAAAGLPLDERIIRHVSYDEGVASLATLELLDQTPPPDALLAASPRLTIGAVAALNSRRVKMPDQLAVAGYTDGRPLPETITYATCEPVEQVGYRAAEMLLERIEGYAAPARDYVLPYQVYWRASSG